MENTSTSELLVVGPGHLGARVATRLEALLVKKVEIRLQNAVLLFTEKMQDRKSNLA